MFRRAWRSADIARYSDLRTRLETRFGPPEVEERMPVEHCPDDAGGLSPLVDEAI